VAEDVKADFLTDDDPASETNDDEPSAEPPTTRSPPLRGRPVGW